MTLNTGQVLKERYRNVRLLGEGGFGAVYRAWDITFEMACAVKENFETSPAAQRQFLREARLLHSLRHPNLPLVKDYFVIEGQGQYLVMDFVEGEDLQQKLEDPGGPLPEAQVLNWIGQVCQALEYLHSQNPPVIHRDIKPANIKVTPEGKAVLVDFGIAKEYDPTRPTTKGAQAATPGYAPFEQYGTEPTDARSDLYALGATLYHLLTGVIPVESIARVSGVRLEEPRALNRQITPQMEQAILKALALHPEGRYQSAKELLEELIIPKTELVVPRTAEVTPASTTPMVSGSKPASLPWWLLGGIAALVLLLVMALGLGARVVVGLQKRSATRAAGASQAALAERLTSTSAVQASQTQPAAKLTVTAAAQAPPVTAAAQAPPGTVLIPAGEFLMGSDADTSLAECRKFRSDCQRDEFVNEEPVHTVYLDAFHIDLYQVTNALYSKCVQAGACSTPGDTRYYPDPSYAQHPVVDVDWNQAREYCQWRGGDLPTEAQWEKAARAGLEGKLYPWGDESPSCTPGAVNGAQFVSCSGRTVEVSSFGPNGYGLYDMAGNVWEWVLDWYQADYYSSSPSANPRGAASGDKRVLRGGSWSSPEDYLLVAFRNGSVPNVSYSFIGFRCSFSP